ncbi:hypothetical protein [Luteolibacter marinus]|uniref:hypothetical protein n=1 Tax=Luteolibacter marinus TaxID=2776705 RepID=UPI0018679832|nr:hypothetical protein [Luteolibacter marinus]
MYLLALLANTPAPSIPADVVAYLLIAVVTVMGGGGAFLGKKIIDSKKVTIDPQPLQVQMQDHFVSRREFDALRAEVRVDFAKLEGLISTQNERVERKHMELLATIERAAKTGVDGRVALWNQLREDKDDAANTFKEQGERIAKVEAGVDIAGRFERVATEAFKKPNTRG